MKEKEKLETVQIQSKTIVRELEGKIGILGGENDRLIQISNDKLKEIELLRNNIANLDKQRIMQIDDLRK